MEWNRSWLKQSYGQKLKKLHAWNAVVILILAVSGILLYIPSIRGELGAARVVLKQVHIYVGLLSIVIIGLYVPLMARHIKQIRKRKVQSWNLGIVLFILMGWSLSGLVLWQLRHVPPMWSSVALFGHDLFSWVGIPYAIYHSLTRLRWLKAAKKPVRPVAVDIEDPSETANPGPTRYERWKQAMDEFRENSPVSRRTFIRLVIGLLIVIGVGPRFIRWLYSSVDTEATYNIDQQLDSTGMQPAQAALKPLPESSPPVGGGRNGIFRIYTVTEFPQFKPDRWNFTVDGLVEKPQRWRWEEFANLKRTAQVSDFHCVTGWSVYHITWEGIPLSQMLKEAGVKSQAKFVKFYSGDGVYIDTLSLEQAQMEDVMVAVMIDGKPIPEKLGGPVRLIVPKMYGYKSVKWLIGIELIEKDEIGYWEERGYDTDAWVNGKA